MSFGFYFKSLRDAEWNSFGGWRNNVKGRMQAEHEFETLTLADKNFRKKFLADEIPQLKDSRSDFARGYRSAWAAFGYQHAEQGIYLGARFLNDEYDYGWLYSMKKMKQKGFISEKHSSTIEELLSQRGCKLENI